MPYDASNLDEETQQLIIAQEYVVQGWCQHVTRRRGEVCIFGAMTNARVGSGAVHRLTEASGLSNYLQLADWNDDPGRTKEEVIDLFNRAIVR